MAIISIANQKGGVGKTTTAFNLGAALAKLSSRVLLIDNDPQGNLTSYALEGDELPQTTIDHIYVTRRKPLAISEVVLIDDNLSLLAGDSELVGADYHLMSRPDKEYVLKNALKEISSAFDFIIIDNPPALNLLTVNGLVASDGVVVPVQMEYFSLEGVVLLQRAIKQLQDRNPGLQLLGIIPNMFNDRRKLNWEVLEALKEQFQEKLFETKIHDSVKIAESSGHGRSIMKYAPQSRSADEYLSFAREIITYANRT